ncbi:hypothetical protein [Agarivorans sp. 1_MG-2023]|uniref:hypothetical protein n=1 Tax=Agarivorans sp. 1_MG-2023 TaxID=3062634 RepID=UPI0026E2135E|nr:hypothetical protein [Agarivorans sp. 1_MG-2023]MDO6765263.1 hypothetical protein [Agarivorans sp. 1_MG-2023]
METYKKIIATALFASTSFTSFAATIYLDPFADNSRLTDGASALSVVSESKSTLTGGSCVGTICKHNDNSQFSNDGTGGLMGLLPYTASLDTQGLGTDWVLDLEYEGVSGGYANGVSYYDDYKTFGFHLHNKLNGETHKIAELLVTGGHLEVGNSHIDGLFNYDWYDDTVDSDLATSFFNIKVNDTITSIYDLWKQGSDVAWRWDFNIAGGEEILYTGDSTAAFRDVSITGEMQIYAVDEPATLAIFGIGLILLSSVNRKRFV